MGKHQRRKTFNRHRSKRPIKNLRRGELPLDCGCRSHYDEPKTLFANQRHAIRIGLKYGVEFRVYRCPRVNGFHISTRTKRGRQRRGRQEQGAVRRHRDA